MEERKGPDFVIAGTQKAGTTWLERQLGQHPQVFTPSRQLHYFDRNYDRGADWYARWFQRAVAGQLLGEKTTEYLDIPTAETFSRRAATDYPDMKVIVILRDPVRRALSALRHMVNSGLEKCPRDADKLLFDDMARPNGKGYRYIKRGFYADQLASIDKYIEPDKLLVLIFEEDIVESPAAGLQRVFEFLGLDLKKPHNLEKQVNQLRLSRLAAGLSYRLHNVPYARGVIRRIDRLLPLQQWEPKFEAETMERLCSIYSEPNKLLFQRLGRNIPSWSK